MHLIAIILSILLVLFLFALAATTGLMVSAAQRPDPRREPGPLPKTLLLLGCKTGSHSIELRIKTAYDWLISHPDAICICSGGQGEDEEKSEAEYMKDRLVEMGIDWKRLPMDRDSSSTLENIRFSHKLIASLNRGESVIIVTNGFHLYRSLYLARHEGLRPLPLAAPNARQSLLAFYLREVLLIWYTWYKIFIHAK